MTQNILSKFIKLTEKKESNINYIPLGMEEELAKELEDQGFLK